MQEEYSTLIVVGNKGNRLPSNAFLLAVHPPLSLKKIAEKLALKPIKQE